MKNVLLALFLTISFFANAQEALKYSDVVVVENATQNQLFDRSKIWLTKTFKSAKDVLQSSDATAGQLIGKALFNFSPKSFMGSEAIKGTISYSIAIYSKDGKYKYVIEDFRHEKFGLLTTAEEGSFEMFGSSKGFRKKTWDDMKAQSEKEAKGLILSLKEAMAKKSDAEF